MTTQVQYPFTTPSNYSLSDSNKIEVSGGFLQLKNLTPNSSTCGATYTNDINLSWGEGVLTGTAFGGAAVSGGELDLSFNDVRYMSYDAIQNADSQQVGCIRWKMTPNYSGTPTNNVGILMISAANVNKNRIMLSQNAADPQMKIIFKDEDAATPVNTSFGDWNPTASQKYRFELNFDVTLGEIRLFIEGNQFGATITNTFIRSSDITKFYIGTNHDASLESNCKFDDVEYFSTVQHVANFDPDYTVPETRYAIDNPYADTNYTFKATEINSITSAETIAGSDLVKATMSASGQHRYVTGGNAADSNGTYAQSSLITELNSDATNLVSARKTIFMRFFLHSDDGTTTPKIDIATLECNTALPVPTVPTLVNTEGFIYDNDGPVSGLVIKARPYLQGYWNQGIFHKYDYETIATTDSDGYFSGDVYVQKTGYFWDFKIGKQKYKVALLDQAEMDLKDAPTFELIEEE